MVTFISFNSYELFIYSFRTRLFSSFYITRIESIEFSQNCHCSQITQSYWKRSTVFLPFVHNGDNGTIGIFQKPTQGGTMNYFGIADRF